MRYFRLRWSWRFPFVLALALFGTGAASVEAEMRQLYTRFRVERAALSPDGRRVAFALWESGTCAVEVRDATAPGPASFMRSTGEPILAVNTLFWATPELLVLVAEDGRVLAIDPASRRMRPLAAPRDFLASRRGDRLPPRLRVMGTTASDPLGLRLEVTRDGGGRADLELHRLDLATGKRERRFAQGLDRPGASLVLDREGKVRLLYARDQVPRGFRYWTAQETDGPGRAFESVLAAGEEAGFAVTPETVFGDRSLPLGFAADPERLYYATNRGRDTLELRALDLRTGRTGETILSLPDRDVVGYEEPWVRNPLVFDRQRQTLAGVRLPGAIPATHWLDADIAAVQADLEGRFPGRNVVLLEWDEARTRFLTLVCSDGDPGRYFVHDRQAGRSIEYFRQLPDRTAPFHPVRRLEVTTPTGLARAYLTTPRAMSSRQPPLVVWLHDGPWWERPAFFNRDAQALADLGYATVEIEMAGTPSAGRARRDIIRQGYDRVPLAELRAVLAVLARDGACDPGRVAVVGHGFGGYLALRALQEYPAEFRCGVAIKPLAELADLWSVEEDEAAASLGGGRASRRAEQFDTDEADAAFAAQAEGLRDRVIAGTAGAPVFEHEFMRWLLRTAPDVKTAGVIPHAAKLARPALLMDDSSRPLGSRREAVSLRRALQRAPRAPDYFELDSRISRLALIQRLARFLDRHLAPAAPPP